MATDNVPVCLIAMFLQPHCITWPAGLSLDNEYRWYNSPNAETIHFICFGFCFHNVFRYEYMIHYKRSHFLTNQGPYSLSRRTSCRKISWSLEAWRFRFQVFQWLWYWTCTCSSAADMPVKCHCDMIIIALNLAVSRLHGIWRKTSYGSVNRCPGVILNSPDDQAQLDAVKTKSSIASLKAMFMGPTWGPPGANRCGPQLGPMLAPWTLLSGIIVRCFCFFTLLDPVMHICVRFKYPRM